MACDTIRAFPNQSIYTIADLERVDKVQLVASRDGEMWDLETSFEENFRFEENDKKYGIFKLELTNKDSFPRSFVIKGGGGRGSL